MIDPSRLTDVLATDLVFFGEDSGAVAALDARSGEPLSRVQVSQDRKASSMPYFGRRSAVTSASRPGSGSERSRCLDLRLRGVFHVPDSKQIAASVIETAGEIDHLQLSQGPG